MLFVVNTLTAQNIERQIVGRDTISFSYTPIDQSYTQRSSGRFVSKVLAGEPWSFMVLPIYTLETNFGLAISAQYTKENFDISATAIASIIGYYNIAIEGNNSLHHRHSLSYGALTKSEPTRLWGLSFDSALGGDYCTYTSKQHTAWMQYHWQATEHSKLGLEATYEYLGARRLDSEAQAHLSDTPHTISSASIGASYDYDTRAITPNFEQSGIHLNIGVKYRPNLLSNIGHDLWSTTALFAYYLRLWRGSTLALDIYGEHNSKHTPWLLQSQIGNNSLVRGYYPGRFRGNTLLSTQLELRQHIWRGIGIVAWGGAGNIFSPNDPFAWRKTLPTYGGGVRYYNKLLTIRADIAFGRNSYNIILGISEAF